MKKLTRPVYTPIAAFNSNILHRLNQNDPSFVRVIFSSRDLGNNGAKVLVEALKSNTNLRALDLSCNTIGAEGMYDIASLLNHQKMMISRNEGGIRTLILGDNNLRDEGVKAMADALKQNILLENLWLDDNFIGAKGLALLATALQRNSRLERLHIRHNSFASLSPLITCTFNRQSLDAIADSNHTLKHVFLDCGYSYECDELELMLKINRLLGKKEARRKKIALYLEEDTRRLFSASVNIMHTKLMPRLLSILAQHGSLSTILCVVKSFPSEVPMFQGDVNVNTPFEDETMYIDESMDVEYISL